MSITLETEMFNTIAHGLPETIEIGLSLNPLKRQDNNLVTQVKYKIVENWA